LPIFYPPGHFRQLALGSSNEILAQTSENVLPKFGHQRRRISGEYDRVGPSL
jgi:hypothetical protein